MRKLLRNIRNLLRKAAPPSPPSDRREAMRFFEDATEGDMNAILERMREGKEVDLTTNSWGRAYFPKERYGHTHYGHGFLRGLSVGDVILKNAESGKVGRFVVLWIEYERDPADMFWAFVCCVGYKD